ncbi:MAG: hypothetical protein GY757_27485, partial [bacterium]|nr:hypothetical protein [bacterium]
MKKIEKRYSYKFTSAQNLNKRGNFEKALKVLKQAEKYKSTDELIALKKEV